MFDRLGVLRAFFSPHNDSTAADAARRWARAFGKDTDLARDLVIQGGLFVQQPVNMVEGFAEVAPIDPYRLAYEAGRRDFAILLLAQGGVTVDDLNELMEDKHVR